MKKILILTDRLPYPANSGTKNLLYNYCRIMHEKINYEITNISFLEEGDDKSLAPAFIARTYVLNKPSNIMKAFNVLKYTVFTKKFPFQVSIYWSEENKKYIEDIISDEKPNIVMADLVRTAEYLKDFNGYKIIDLQDLLSLRYKRQLGMNSIDSNPYGAYLYGLPNLLQRILMMKRVRYQVLKSESFLLAEYEKKIGTQYDKAMFVAENETRIYNEILNGNKAITVPLGVDVEHYAQVYNLEKSKYKIAFMGMLNVAHNETGIIHFIEDIFPLVLEKQPKSQLYIIGGGLTKRLKRYETNNIVFTGEVKDIRSEVGRCRVFVCPLVFGSGIKTKNLEAMAMGVPVVTTSVGAENINTCPGEICFIEDDNKMFSEQVLKLMEDETLWCDMRKRAFEFVRDKFSWDVTENVLKEML